MDLFYYLIFSWNTFNRECFVHVSYLTHTEIRRNMNCLKNNRQLEYIEEKPSAPVYYPPQPPYNPDIVYENIEVIQASVDSAWGFSYRTMHYVGNANGEYDDEHSEWGRRSLYEGVNWMPVSEQVS